MSFIPRIHEIYKHFKGDLYQITAIAEHTETGEMLVVYQAMYGEFKTYARPLSMFVSRVDKEKYPDVEQEFRFELQGPEAARQRAESEPKQVKTEAVRESGAEEAKTVEFKTKDSQMEEIGAGKTMAAASETEENGTEKAKTEEVKSEDIPSEDSAESALDPLLLEFLDADSYAERLNILAALQHRITDEMITTMAIASDVEIEEGSLESRYDALRNCLLTLERYECNRLR